MDNNFNSVESEDLVKMMLSLIKRLAELERNFLSSKAISDFVSYEVLSNGATAMKFDSRSVVKVTPTQSDSYTTNVPPAGFERTLIILTSGTSSYTITFGSGFKSTGTLATGTTSARVFVVKFVSDGTNLYEVSRTSAMVA